MKKRKVLKLWQSLLLVFAGLIGVGGVTVLSLYLMGNLSDPKVEPQDMAFENSIVEGNGFYNETLGQYEVSSDKFKITIASLTEGVTETKVSLSLLGGTVKDGYVSDNVIKVPAEVELNKPFTVTVQQTFDETLQKNIIAGGTSILTAKSSNVLLTPQTIKIAVDCPVDSIEVNIAEKAQTGETQEVVVGETFRLETLYTPEQSGYLFMDENRKKEVFYSSTTQYISYDWDNDRFYANTKSGNAFDTVTVYTFKNSYYQELVLAQYSDITDRELLSSSVLRYFEQNPDAYVAKQINIKVLDVDVENVYVEEDNKTYNMLFDQYFTITTKSSNGDASFGLDIKDSKGNSLNSLFSNVGIRLTHDVKQAIFDENLVIDGGKMMKVETLNEKVKISKIDYVKGMDLTTTGDGVSAAKIEYYLLPNISPKASADYFWRFATSSEDNASISYNMKLNFFYENDEGNFENFFRFDEADTENSKDVEKSFSLSVKANTEENIGWISQLGANLTVNFNDDGEAIPASIDLSEHINSIDDKNLYQSTRYFLLFDDSATTEITDANVHDYFVCEEGVLYNDISISNLEMPGGYFLYELNNSSSVLTAKKSFSGKVYVIFATIKVHADNTPYGQAGNYSFVKISAAKEVTVNSSLSIAFMQPQINLSTFAMDEDKYYYDDVTESFYLPAVNKDDSGSDANMLQFSMKLSDENGNGNLNTDRDDPNNDIDKVLAAYSTPSETSSLKLECFDAEGKTAPGYVALQSLVFNEDTQQFEGYLTIDSALLNATSRVDYGTQIRMRLVYNDGAKQQSKEVLLRVEEETRDLYVYNQQVASFTGAFESEDALKNAAGYNDISVKVSASEGTTIKWGDVTLTADAQSSALDKLNQKLKFEMLDQFGKEIVSSDGLYFVKFEETLIEGASSVLSFDETGSRIQNFSSTKNAQATAYLTAYVEDANGNKIGQFDADGVFITEEIHKSPTLKFIVESESISEVWYDSNDWHKEVNTNEKIWKKNSNTSTVTVERYVVSNDTVVLNDLIKAFTAGNEPETVNDVDDAEAVATEITFDNTFLAGLGSNKANMMAMFNKIVLADGEPAVADPTQLDSYANKKLKSIEFKWPFKERKEIVFKVTGQQGSLFDMTLKFVCLPNLSVNTSAFETYQGKYEDYLVKNGNKISVFAGETFKLSEYLKVNRLSERGSDTIGTGYYYIREGLEITGSSYEDASIVIPDNIFDYTTAKLKVYYGAVEAGEYIYSKSIELYINPNIAVQQKVEGTTDAKPFLDISSLSKTDANGVVTSEVMLSEAYNFYKLTDYVATGSFEGLTSLNLAGVTLNYENVTDGIPYIAIQHNQAKYDANVYFNDEDQMKIELDIGETYGQEFSITFGDGATAKPVKAVRVVEAYSNGVRVGDAKIVTCGEEGLKIFYDIGVDIERGNIVTEKASGEPVELIEYDGEKYLLLNSGNDYSVDALYAINEIADGSDLFGGGTTLRTRASLEGYVSYVGNNFYLNRVFKDIKDNALTVTFGMKAFVSEIGDQFVYYYTKDPTTFNNTNMAFNSYSYETKDGKVDVELKTLLEVSDANIYQELVAGNTYTVLHDTDATSYDQTTLIFETAVGFYYDGNKLGSVVPELSIVEDAEGYIEGLAKLNGNELVINHLEEAGDDTFITLKLKIEGKEKYFEYYYRVKVVPSYKLGSVLYPYAEDAEYIEEFSKYYSDGKYTINLDEQYDGTNSKYNQGSRFPVAYDMSGNVMSTSSKYSIKSISVGGEPASIDLYKDNIYIDGTNLIYNLKTALAVDVVIEKAYQLAGANMIESEREYIFKFNQGHVYNHSLSISRNGGTATSLKAVDNVYTFDIVAGEGEIKLSADIKISSNDTLLDQDFNVYAKMISEGTRSGETSEILVVSNGVALYTTKDDAKNKTNSTKSLDETVNNGKSDWTVTPIEENGIIVAYELKKSGESKGYVSPDSVQTKTISTLPDVLDDAKTKVVGKDLYFTPKSSIANDMTFEIGYYTDQRVVFKVLINATSIYDWKLSESLNPTGGHKYYFDSIFSTLINNVDDSTPNLAIELVNGTDEDIAGPGITLADIIKIDDTSKTIEFAQMPEDAVFNFQGTLTDSAGGNAYKFNFSLNVGASLNIAKKRTADKTTDVSKYTNVAFDVTIADIKSAFDFAVVDELGTYVFDADTDSVTTSITYTEFTDETIYPKQTLTVAYKFEGNKIFEFDVVYEYKLAPSVEVDQRYPTPDGTNELEREYVSTKEIEGLTGKVYKSEAYTNFFNSNALFSDDTRIGVTHKFYEISTEADFMSTVGECWTIAVSSISNAKVVYSHTSKSGTIDSQSADKTIFENSVKIEDTTNRPSVDITFEIENSQAEGQVQFMVSVNGVSVLYDVTICVGNAYSLSTNAPNYIDNKETIYAEDLVGKELNIFAENRIVKFQTTATTLPGTYYLKLTNGTQTVAPQVVVTEAGKLENYDLGKSYAGFTYEGVYTSESDALNPEFEKINEESMFVIAPKLTSRLVASYAGVEIKLNSDVYLGDASQNNITNKNISADDYGNVEPLTPYLWVNSSKIDLSAVYNYCLDIEFAVDGTADDASEYTTIEIEALGKDTPYSLMTDFSALSIYNKRTSTEYGATGFGNSKGTMLLELYGKTIDISDNAVAQAIHDKLTSTTDEDGIIYSTGLTPYKSEGTSFDNYISIAGLDQSGKIVDYKLYANGANNDGNHVMMRIKYSVELSDDTSVTSVEKCFNVLFKVTPNSTVKFKAREGSSSFVHTSSEIINGETIETNRLSPYIIDGSAAKTHVLTSLNAENADQIVEMLMYGSEINSASSANYTIKWGATGTGISENGITYNNAITINGKTPNDWEVFVDASGAKQATLKISSNSDSNPDLEFGTAQLGLGEKYIMIEIENVYGYKARFYATVRASTNPVIRSLSTSVITEGQALAFGAEFQTVTPVKVIDSDNTEWTVMEPFTYAKGKTEIVFTNVTLSKVVATFTDSDENVYQKQLVISENSATIADSNVWTCIEGDKLTADPSEKERVWTDEQLDNMAITIRFAGEIKNSYTVTYNDKSIDQTYSVSAEYSSPSETYADETAATVVLGGIEAYAFDKISDINIGIVGDVTKGFMSRVDNLKVSKVEFYYNGESIGTATGSTGQLITDGSKVFYSEKTKAASAGSYYGGRDENNLSNDSGIRKVPRIEGLHFGLGDTLTNVQMIVTLTTDDVTPVTTTVSTTITLKREATISPFKDGAQDNTIVYDGNRPQVINSYSNDMVNDTLEVTMSANSGVKLIIHNQSITSIVEGVGGVYTATTSSGTFTPKIVELTNNRAFTTTQYVGISQNIVGLTVRTINKFYVYVVEGDATFKYNDNLVEKSTTSKSNGTSWQNYFLSSTALTLRINHVDELSGGQKTERLYFLYSLGEKEKYQYMETFSVKALYEEAHNYDSTTGVEQDQFTVDDYMKISNGTKSYYMIPFANWAKNIKVKNAGGTETNVINASNNINVPAYKFEFKINLDKGGAACIDEFGMITTSEAFDINSHLMVVDMYMKVSGIDGNFEKTGGSIKIGSFMINLDAGSHSVGSSITIAGIYNTSQPETPVVVPTGYTLTYYGTNYSLEKNTSTTSWDTPYYAQVGQEVQLEDLKLSTSKNQRYYILKCGGEYVYYNNMDSYTFTKAGEYDVVIMYAGRSSTGSDAFGACFYKVPVIVSDNTINENNSIEFTANTRVYYDTDDITGKAKISDDYNNYTWYELKADGSLSSVTVDSNGKISISSEVANTSRFVKQFVGVHNNGTIKNVTNTYFAVDDGDDVYSIALSPDQTYKLSNLDPYPGGITDPDTDKTYPFTYTFYDENRNEIDERVSFTNNEHTSVEKTYYMLKTAETNNGVWTKMYKFKVTFNMVGTNVYSRTMQLKSGTNITYANSVVAEIKTALGLTATDTITLSTITNNELTVVDQAVNVDTNKKLFLVEYKNANGETRFARFSFNFLVYKEQLTLVEWFEGNILTLSTLNGGVTNAIEGYTSIETVSSIKYYTAQSGQLQEVLLVGVDISYAGQLFVEVEGLDDSGATITERYLFDIVVYNNSISIEKDATITTVEGYNSVLLEKLGYANGEVSWYTYLSNALTSCDTDAPAIGTIYYAEIKVSGHVYWYAVVLTTNS